MFRYRKFRFVIPIAVAGSGIGILCWIYITGADTARLFEFGISAGFGTMIPGLLVAHGSSENTFEDGEKYDAVRDANQKQERFRGAIPILVTTVLAGTLIIAISLAINFLILPLLNLGG